ncbi:MAG: hypothetical protein ABI868_23175 [Acidobacteriota bacterium]
MQKLLIVTAGLMLMAASPTLAAGPSLSVSGTTLQIDGRAGFLLGVSLFDALGPTPPRDQDLDALKAWGSVIVRVWAHWRQPIYGADGALTASGRARLLALSERLGARGLILELVLLRPGQLAGQPYALFASPEARLRAIDSITLALRDSRHVLFDLYNEHDHPDGPISHAELRVMRDRVKAADPQRIVTVSSTGNHLMTPDGRIGPEEARNLAEEAGTTAPAVAADVVGVHFPRTDDWAASTATRVGAMRAALDRLGRRLPIYLNEEQRADRKMPMPPEVYLRAASGARQAGAAGWLLHTDAGYDLARKPFIEALMPTERTALEQLRRP